MELSKKKSEEQPRNLWMRLHVTIGSTIESEDTDEKIIYMEDLEKRARVYGICGECNEPGTGSSWCRPCNAKRFKENFKNWTSGNKDIDELIQQSQLNALHFTKFLEWIPYNNFEDITYITSGGFGKIYSAKWPEGYIRCWDIENQKWIRDSYFTVALKSLDNSSDIGAAFLNEVKSHLLIYFEDVVRCFGVTQDPITKNYMMVLRYCKHGNLRNYLRQSEYINLNSKIGKLSEIARGLLNIHNSGKVHKDFHSGNILLDSAFSYISDLGMCQPVNDKMVEEGIYGVLPYMAPEVLRGHQYTKEADIYSFGIIMNEFMTEEIPYNNIPHDHSLGVKICKGFRPKISNDTPKLISDLIIKCWDAKVKNRPTTKELYQILKKFYNERNNKNSEIHSQIVKCEKIRKTKLKRSGSNENRFNKPENIQIHSKAIYTSRLLNFNNLPEPTNSSDLLFTSNSDVVQSPTENLISECFDCQLSESDLDEIDEIDEIDDA
ncbi:kinase-like domain-containing protein [Rhizophagus diaphanus]|nr:kinase-like domain-containing protein [Rhizophagus diaphanus] [Rhizophagus sp. MUCL 43196]